MIYYKINTYKWKSTKKWDVTEGDKSFLPAQEVKLAPQCSGYRSQNEIDSCVFGLLTYYQYWRKGIAAVTQWQSAQVLFQGV